MLQTQQGNKIYPQENIKNRKGMMMKTNLKKKLALAVAAGLLTGSVGYASPALVERESLN